MCKLPTASQLTKLNTPQMLLNSQRALQLLNNMLATLEAARVTSVTQGNKNYER